MALLGVVVGVFVLGFISPIALAYTTIVVLGGGMLIFVLFHP